MEGGQILGFFLLKNTRQLVFISGNVISNCKIVSAILTTKTHKRKIKYKKTSQLTAKKVGWWGGGRFLKNGVGGGADF